MMAKLFPLLGTLRGYRRGDLGADLVAGLTTGVMLVPQAMAYAMLAGLPPVMGLYASVAPLVLYALLGTARELAVGPVAMDSLLVAAGVGVMAASGSDRYLELAILLALMVGTVEVVLGLLRGGFLVNFLSAPVVAGFTSAAALIIGLNQLGHLLGMPLSRSTHVHQILVEAAGKLGEVNPVTAAIGLSSVAALLLMRRFSPRLPRALIVVGVATLLTVAFGLEQHGVAIVGEIPRGLPSPRLALPSWDDLSALFPTALAIALVGFMEAISVAKAYALRRGYELDPNRELVALGAANLGAGLFGGYPVTGGFSRTAVNAQAGARTQLAALVTASFVALVLLFLTPLLTSIPKAVLAAIIMAAVFGLIDVAEARRLWRVKRGDLALMGLTFLATLAVGIQEGLAIGVGASLLTFIVRSTRPHWALLGRVPGTESYRNLARHRDLVTTEGVLVLRIDAQLYFGNVSFLKDTVRRLVADHPGVQALVLDASSINQLDSSAETALSTLADELRDAGIDLHLAHVKGPVLDVMERSGLVEKLGRDHLHESVHDAVQAAAREEGGASEPSLRKRSLA